MVARGRAPEAIRCDKGPELTAHVLRDWCRFTGTGTAYIVPGEPWQNPFVESFNSRARDELLAVEQFDTLLEAQVLAEDWRRDYNTIRPHSSLGQKPPAMFAAAACGMGRTALYSSTRIAVWWMSLMRSSCCWD